jgi:hypothetical protein
MDFRWIPHKGIDLEAVERMKQHFPKPAEAPPIAWFITGEVSYRTELLDTPISEIDDFELQSYLDDMAGGIKNFGRYEEWIIWFKHLLPYLLDRIYDDALSILTISYFLNVYPNEIIEEYPHFREDVLNTLPQCIMADHLWDGNDFAKDHWWFDDWAGYWSPALHASLFFCLKYLATEEIPGWVQSIAAIKGSEWQQEIVRCLNGLSKMFYYMEHPEDLPEVTIANSNDRKERPISLFLEAANIYWHYSYLLFSGIYSSKNIYDYLPKANIETFWDEVQKYPQLAFTNANR